MSVLDFVHLGSTLSLRSFSRFGSSVSVLDFLHLGSSLSLRSFARLGSAVSVRGLSRFGSSMSVLDFVHLGSTLSLRSFSRFGSSVSVLDFVHLGSSLSLRSFSRFGSSVSVLDFLHLGSSLSLRSFARMGSAVSATGVSRFGSSVSIFDFLHLGSSLSLRSFSRFGSSVSVLDFLHLGSSLSLRSFARLGSHLSLTGTLDVYGTSTRTLATSTAGGTLHGVWSSDNVVSASDRRLKKDIRPLESTMPHAEVSWLLRELRPVSFSFRRGPESKHIRYGFIAQELERVLPSMVREKDEYKHVIYQDLIALLTLTAQAQQARLEAMDAEVRALREIVTRQGEQTEKRLSALEARTRSDMHV